MPRGAFKRTVTLELERFPASVSCVDIVKAIKDHFVGYTVLSVEFIPGNRAQVTFDCAEHKEFIETLETVSFGDVECRVVGGGGALVLNLSMFPIIHSRLMMTAL